MLDHQLNPYLLEINMGPNLTADEKRIPLKHLYAQVAYNVFNLVGVGSYLSRDTFKIRWQIYRCVRKQNYYNFLLPVETTKPK